MYLLWIASFEQRDAAIQLYLSRTDAAAEPVSICQAEIDLLKTQLGDCNNNFQKLMAQNLAKQVCRNAIIGRFFLCCSCYQLQCS